MRTSTIANLLARNNIKFSVPKIDPQMEDDCIDITNTNMHISNNAAEGYCSVVTEVSDGFVFEDVATLAQILKSIKAILPLGWVKLAGRGNWKSSNGKFTISAYAGNIVTLKQRGSSTPHPFFKVSAAKAYAQKLANA